MTNLRKFFWEKYSLDQLNQDEWEALCDGCAKCCLLKIVDKEKIFITNISCSKLKLDSCRCSDYLNREKNVKAWIKEYASNDTWDYIRHNVYCLVSTFIYCNILSHKNGFMILFFSCFVFGVSIKVVHKSFYMQQI